MFQVGGKLQAMPCMLWAVLLHAVIANASSLSKPNELNELAHARDSQFKSGVLNFTADDNLFKGMIIIVIVVDAVVEMPVGTKDMVDLKFLTLLLSLFLLPPMQQRVVTGSVLHDAA